MTLGLENARLCLRCCWEVKFLVADWFRHVAQVLRGDAVLCILTWS